MLRDVRGLRWTLYVAVIVSSLLVTAPASVRMPSARLQPVQILGITVDADELPWRTFTAKNGMMWPQYRDGYRRWVAIDKRLKR
jgi:hypothetical protein